MKNLILVLLIGTSAFAQDGVINFKGDIRHAAADSVIVTSKSGRWRKAMALDANGHFAGKIQQGANDFTLRVGDQKMQLWLENEYDLTIAADAENILETLHFEGVGAKENDFMVGMERDKSKLISKYKAAFTDEELQKDVDAMVDAWVSFLKSRPLTDMMVTKLKFKIDYIDRKNLPKEIAKGIYKSRMVNTKSPDFNFENFKGGTSKLSQFTGKYVYIDVWATWCGPCKMEIPFLQEVEQVNKGKNIVFISLSVDKAKDHDKWKEMVAKDGLGGVQLMADKDWESDFIKAYGIHSIPRFILIDPKGMVIDADAKRPSNPELQLELNKLLK